MAERDPWDFLWHLINDRLAREYPVYDAAAIADDILNAGWRPPARVIETAEELDALPIGTIVVDAFAASCTRVHDDPLWKWVRATSAVPWGRHFHPPRLPVTVLWEPEVDHA
ncbi:hypothetical protein ACFXG4_03930 [Nocardia sp. NPDC059246]|uniref:hypothetical protein n=1 Tax=unclassified Nocardia TaxID=2637762 RepID=UPI0036BBE45D